MGTTWRPMTAAAGEDGNVADTTGSRPSTRSAASAPGGSPGGSSGRTRGSGPRSSASGSSGRSRSGGAASSASDRAEESGAQAASATGASPHGSSHDTVCSVAFCPICTAVSAVNRVSPEVVEHLLLAGQQFLLALRAVIDARADDIERRPSDDAEPSMQRIDIG